MDAAILLSSAGRRGQLLGCFRESASELGIGLKVVAADARPGLSAACGLADAAVEVPPCRSGDFVPALRDVCERHRVKLLVPTIDTELQVLAEHAEHFAEIGVRVAIASPGTVSIARDKAKTAALMEEAGIGHPRTLSAEEFRGRPEALKWPVILKPRAGSSSIGIVRPSTPAAAAAAAASKDLIVQELWEGREYTVNVFFDREGRLRCAVPHWRIETRAGEVSKGRTERLAALAEAARKMAARLPGARGPMCFQAIVRPDGAFAVFEINARFGGGYPLAHRAGAKFTTWLLQEALGLPSSAGDDWREGVTMLRYDTAVFA